MIPVSPKHDLGHFRVLPLFDYWIFELSAEKRYGSGIKNSKIKPALVRATGSYLIYIFI
jgi:hypothetical protein